jgi:hypothetical protein
MLASCYQPRLAAQALKLRDYADGVSSALRAVSDEDPDHYSSVDIARVTDVRKREEALIAAAERFRESIVNEIRRAFDGGLAIKGSTTHRT